MRAIGLMSGTSLDGMDAALLETDGQGISGFGPALTIPFGKSEKTVLQQAVDDALVWRFEGVAPASFAPAARLLATIAEKAVRAITKKATIELNMIDLVGFHGQTVLHQPPTDGHLGQTCQIGDARELAMALGVSVVHDFRAKDMQAGGHGAPLAPAYHRARAADLPKPLMVLNIGGVGNLTYLGQDGEMLAFDTGPGNGPLDAWVRERGAGEMDVGGVYAAKGKVDRDCLHALMSSPYFAQKPPKSADRWDFDMALVRGLSLEDGAATLTAWCAQSIALALEYLPERPRNILICGGGRHNPQLMAQVQKRTGIAVQPVEAAGWRGDALEAEAFAYLAVRVFRGLPTSWPQTTGVRAPVSGGNVIKYNKTIA